MSASRGDALVHHPYPHHHAQSARMPPPPYGQDYPPPHLQQQQQQYQGAHGQHHPHHPPQHHHSLPPPQQLPPPHHFAPPAWSSSGSDGQRNYRLVVIQQPDRARMCGFGDKDRRPITPPPCVRLDITDARTGRPVNPSELDGFHQHFVLNVDLWDEFGSKAVNLVRQSNNSPNASISMAQTTSFPPPMNMSMHMWVPNPQAQYRGSQVGMPGGEMYQMPPNPYGYPPSPHGLPPPGHAQHPASLPPPSHHGSGGSGQTSPTGGSLAPPTSPPAGNTYYTRNLIGSTSCSATILHDTRGPESVGFYFVLQDMSVRQEGRFRLKMSFVNVGGQTPGTLHHGLCRVLATVLSDVFTVYSAKRFPGVRESTDLSVCFSRQGVKLPIRKDGSSGSAPGSTAGSRMSLRGEDDEMDADEVTPD